MADIGVIWHGVREFEHGTVRLSERAKLAGKAASLTAGHELAAAAAGIAPRISGDLAGSIRVAEQAISGTPLVRVGPTIVYGRRVDIGFKGRKSARGVKARRAQGIDTGRRGLQPTKPSHFLEHALTASRERILATYRKAWTRAITK